MSELGDYTLVKNTDWKEVEVNGEMIEIPSGWEVERLNQICEIKGGISAPKKFVEQKKDETVPFFRVSNLSSRVKFLTKKETKEFLNKGEYKTFPKGTILIAKSGESIRQKYRSFLTEPSVIVGHIAALVANKNKNYLYNLLKYFSPEDVLLKDSTMPALSTNDLGNFQIYSPPLPQQFSISAILSQQESVIENIESLIEKYEARFRYLSDELLSGRLRAKEINGTLSFYKNPEENWKEVEVNGEMTDIPSDWGVDSLNSLMIDNSKSKIKAGSLKKLGKYPAFNCSEKSCYFYDSFITDGENLFLSTGGRASVHYFNGKSSYSTDVYSLKSNNIISNRFLFFMLKKDILRIESMFYGAGLKHLNKKDFKTSFWTFPQKQEQNIIASILSNQEDLIQNQKDLLIKEKQKFDWLLDNLLSGKYLVQEKLNPSM